jgi:hypothetical protein
MNHAERPTFVTSAAIRVATKIMTTAPGQNKRSSGVGPTKELINTSTDATKSAICDALPSAIPTLRSRRILRAPANAWVIAAAPSNSAKTIKATKAGVIPKSSAAIYTDSTNT